MKVTQPKERLHRFRIQGTATAAILMPSTTTDASLTDTGVGDYLLTFSTPFVDALSSVVGSSHTADSVLNIGTVTASTIQILGFDATDGTTAKDIDFSLIVIGKDGGDSL